jgi:hypothetical protein
VVFCRSLPSGANAKTLSKSPVSSRSRRKNGYACDRLAAAYPGGPPLPLWFRPRGHVSPCQCTSTRRSGSGTGSDFIITARIRLKIAVFAPMPRASDTAITTARPGLRPMLRTVYRRSLKKPSIGPSPSRRPHRP